MQRRPCHAFPRKRALATLATLLWLGAAPAGSAQTNLLETAVPCDPIAAKILRSAVARAGHDGAKESVSSALALDAMRTTAKSSAATLERLVPVADYSQRFQIRDGALFDGLRANGRDPLLFDRDLESLRRRGNPLIRYPGQPLIFPSFDAGSPTTQVLIKRPICYNCIPVNPVGPSIDIANNAFKFPSAKPVAWRPPFAYGKVEDATCKSALEAFKEQLDSLLASNEGNPEVLSPAQFVSWWYIANEQQRAKPKVQNVWMAAKIYASSCTSDLAPAGLSKAEIDNAVGAIGIGRQRMCTGTRIADDLVLTARHCFMAESGGTLTADLDPSGIRDHWFEFSSAETLHKYSVCGIEKRLSSDEYRFDTDAVVIRISKPRAPSPGISVSSNTPDVGQYLYVPGLNLAQEQAGPFTPVAGKVSGCQAVAVSNVCVIHGCQTLPGTSGAPVFMSDTQGNVAPAIVGIHIGGKSPTPDNPGACAPPAGFFTANTPNAALRANFFKDITKGIQ